MFVRNPLARLVSAFRDRLHGDHINARRTFSAEILAHLAARQPANQSTGTRRQVREMLAGHFQAKYCRKSHPGGTESNDLE